MRPPRTQRWLRGGAVWLIQIGVIAILVKSRASTCAGRDATRLLNALRTGGFHPGVFALAVVPLVVERIVRPFRLGILLGGAIPLSDVIAVQSVSQLVNLVLPMRSGEFSLLVMLRALGHTSFSYALSIVLIDRLMDVVMVLLLFAWALMFLPGLPAAADTGATVLTVGTIGAIAAMLIAARHKAQLLSVTGRMIAGIAGTRAPGWLSRLEAVVDGFAVLSDPPKLLVASIATIVTWGLAALASWLMLLAIWPVGPFAAVVLAMCLATIGTTLISVPAGIGVSSCRHYRRNL